MGKKLLLNNDHIPGINTYEVYRKNGGYGFFRKTIKKKKPEGIFVEVKKYGMRGRGRGGISTGRKRGFLGKHGRVGTYINCYIDEP